MNMDSIIWYCNEDWRIFPTYEDARDDCVKFLAENETDYSDLTFDELFNTWYERITFREYNDRLP